MRSSALPGSAVYILAMRNAQHQHRPALIVNPANDAILSDAVPPEPHLVACEGFTEISWVVVPGDAFLEKPRHSPLGGPIYLLEFA